MTVIVNDLWDAMMRKISNLDHYPTISLVIIGITNRFELKDSDFWIQFTRNWENKQTLELNRIWKKWPGPSLKVSISVHRIQNTEYRIQNLYCHPWSYSFDHRGYRQIKSLHNYMAQYSSNMNVIRVSPVYAFIIHSVNWEALSLKHRHITSKSVQFQ